MEFPANSLNLNGTNKVS